MISTRMKNLHPYIPGEQPKDRTYIKLNANENPYPPSKEVTKALSSFIQENPMKLSLYPDPDSNDLKTEIASMLNKTGGILCRAKTDNGISPSKADKIPFEVTKEMIYAGNGSDEVLSFVFYAFFDSGAKLVLPEFTYSFYPVYAGFYDIKTDIVPLNKDWTLNTKEMLLRAKKNGSGLIFANPNAPTGLSLTREQVRQMLLESEPEKVFVVDEAYADFGGESCIPLLAEFKNLVIVRTFSKSMCGAGLRLGYVVSSPELVNYITTVKNSLNHFPLDALAQTAGIASCKDIGYYIECAKKVAFERDSFLDFLAKKNWFVIPSSTNFVFAKHPSLSGSDVYKAIKEHGILVRHFSTPGIEEFVRITIGNAQQMASLKKVIESL